MILYNITIIVDDSILDEWQQWVNKNFIDPITETGLFIEKKVFKILASPNEGTTFSIQFFAEDAEKIATYRAKFETSIMEKHQQQFKGLALSFISLMEQI